MRLSQLFFKTFKQQPSEAEILSHILLEQAGYIKKLDKGLYSLTPLMWRVITKLLNIIRQELNQAGLQEVLMPFLQPKRIWDQSNRWDDYVSDKLLYHFKDREERELCLGPTHEEAATELIKNWVTSYKQLPINVFQVSQKFRDEIRCRFGLMRAKEFLMKDAYAFCESEASMDEQYQVMRQAYQKIFNQLQLEYAIVTADGGSIGKGRSEEFQVLASSGEDKLMVCGEIALNVEAAPCRIPLYSYNQDLLALEKKPTPGVVSIDDLVSKHQVAIETTLKTLIYRLVDEEEHFVAICVRGDRQVNEVKLKNIFNARECELASDEKIKSLTKSSPGSLGPYRSLLPVYVDDNCKAMTNFSCGANEDGHHYFNVNWDRDCPDCKFIDVLQAEEGDHCPLVEGGVYSVKRGIEVGHIFNLGSRYSQALEATFLDASGKKQAFHMGCYGIGVSRLAQACIEQKADEKGLKWPMAIAPYCATIFAAGKDEKQLQASEELYESCKSKGLEVLLDDRKERMGFKIKDADLMGIPFKVIIGRDFLDSQMCEVESREGEKQLIAYNELIVWLEQKVSKR